MWAKPGENVATSFSYSPSKQFFLCGKNVGRMLRGCSCTCARGAASTLALSFRQPVLPVPALLSCGVWTGEVISPGHAPPAAAVGSPLLIPASPTVKQHTSSTSGRDGGGPCHAGSAQELHSEQVSVGGRQMVVAFLEHGTGQQQNDVCMCRRPGQARFRFSKQPHRPIVASKRFRRSKYFNFDISDLDYLCNKFLRAIDRSPDHPFTLNNAKFSKEKNLSTNDSEGHHLNYTQYFL